MLRGVYLPDKVEVETVATAVEAVLVEEDPAGTGSGSSGGVGFTTIGTRCFRSSHLYRSVTTPTTMPVLLAAVSNVEAVANVAAVDNVATVDTGCTADTVNNDYTLDTYDSFL